MKKLAIICDSREHAVRFFIRPNGLREEDCVIITPDNAEKMHGHIDINYYELRPMYARELSYAKQHGWQKVQFSKHASR